MSDESRDEELFSAALIMPTGERPHFLARACEDDAATLGPAVSPMHPDLVIAKIRLGEALLLQGRMSEAEPLLLDALRRSAALFGENNSQTAWILDDLAEMKWRQGHLEEATAYARRAVAGNTTTLGASHTTTASSAMVLGRILLDHADFAEAEAVARRALDIYIGSGFSDHQYIAAAEALLGEIYLATGRTAEAEPVLRTSMDRWQRSGAPAWRAARSASCLGEALYRLGRTTEGRQYMIESADALSADPKAEKRTAQEARARVSRYVDKTSAQRNSSTRMASGGRT